MATMVHGGGGGGVSSSELTAVGANVLEGTTYVGKDTNDESGEGKMVNYASSSTEGYPNYLAAVSWLDPEKSGNVEPWIRLRVPKAGYYNSNNFLYAIASTFGNATPNQVLDGRLFTSNDGLKKTGTMTNRSGTEGSYGNYSASASWDATNKRVRMKIPANAYYNGYNYLYSAGTNFGDVSADHVLSGKTFTSNAGLKVNGKMNDLSKKTTVSNYVNATLNSTASNNVNGYVYVNPSNKTNEGYITTSTLIRVPVANLSPTNIKSGVKVGGVTGTWEGYVATNKEIYDNGAWGSGYSNSTVHNSGSDSSWVLTNDTTCIICDWTRSYQYWTSSDGVFIFSKTSPLNASGYSRLTIKTSCQATSGYSYAVPNELIIEVYSITDTEIAGSSVTYTAKDTKVDLSINLTSITQSVYFKLYTYSRQEYPGGSNQYSPDFTIYNITLA